MLVSYRVIFYIFTILVGIWLIFTGGRLVSDCIKTQYCVYDLPFGITSLVLGFEQFLLVYILRKQLFRFGFYLTLVISLLHILSYIALWRVGVHFSELYKYGGLMFMFIILVPVLMILPLNFINNLIAIFIFKKRI